MKNYNKKLKIEKDCLGECIHTALRKCCDSAPTTIAWNLIQLPVFDIVWKEYLDLAWEELKSCNLDNAWVGLKKAAEKITYGNCPRSALRQTFELFSENDWNGMASFFGETE